MSEHQHHHHHHHGHDHGHSHDHSHNHTQINGEYWSSAAATTFDQDWVVACQRQTLEHLRENLSWFGVREGSSKDDQPERKMMDYACGEGYISRFFTTYFSKCIGVDVAPGMVERFNQTARKEGFPETQLYAVEGNLTESEVSPSLAKEEFFNFDLIIIAMALHHVADPQALVNRLVERLSPGGAVVVVDWEKEDDNSTFNPGKLDHPAARTVAHVGFNKQEMNDMFSKAGCKDSDYTLMKEQLVVPSAWGDKKTLFFARGRK
ncbi:uncharacterized protein GIQ15_05290 [Arthroderma uncinatum]|uniref:uncharacterized protein n=1 Tax=Arthroderma uncinatum TaxID=74035 RepID=UPI00144A8436|nr:uncharacterized protein GIQ15_05290 [Arthroderma uncinatum]KAF3482531.1 hypothetical protein GIQ15_05290 [Arthroderma uncinatum]